MIQPRPTNHDIGPIVLSLFRISILLIFVMVVLRLFQLQVVGGEQWQQRADENRYESFEVRPLRGIIYDRKNVILVRNRPSFQIGLIPEYVIQDDDTTKEVDEEVVMLIDVLRLLRADKDRDITVRIQELLFRRLGQRDYRAQLENETVGIQVSTISVPDPSTPNIPVDVQRVLPGILRNTPRPKLVACHFRRHNSADHNSRYKRAPAHRRACRAGKTADRVAASRCSFGARADPRPGRHHTGSRDR